jgi:DMSO/TMAO reductase YedYZ molybdopterin-dependent catalytic subunit
VVGYNQGDAMLKNMKIMVIALLFFAVLGGCKIRNKTAVAGQRDAVSGASRARYREGEITEYNGARLDPAIGPSDNSISGAQWIDIKNYRLGIGGLVENPLQLTYEEVLALEPYEKKITLYCVEGWNAAVLWKGARIMEMIDMSKAKAQANTVIFHCVDGYTTSLPLQTVKDRDLILAYSANGLDLPRELGYPFIVVAEDKLGYKWARWVRGIELSNNQNYRGFWELNGYNNEADVQVR